MLVNAQCNNYRRKASSTRLNDYALNGVAPSSTVSSRLYYACKRGEGGIDVDIRNFAPRLDEYVAGLRIAIKARFTKGVYMTCSRSGSWSGDGLHRSGVVSPRRGCAVEGANRVARPRRVVSSFLYKQFLPTLDLCQIRAQARMAA
jgi:hypothetical protein